MSEDYAEKLKEQNKRRPVTLVTSVEHPLAERQEIMTPYGRAVAEAYRKLQEENVLGQLDKDPQLSFVNGVSIFSWGYSALIKETMNDHRNGSGVRLDIKTSVWHADYDYGVDIWIKSLNRRGEKGFYEYSSISHKDLPVESVADYIRLTLQSALIKYELFKIGVSYDGMVLGRSQRDVSTDPWDTRNVLLELKEVTDEDGDKVAEVKIGGLTYSPNLMGAGEQGTTKFCTGRVAHHHFGELTFSLTLWSLQSGKYGIDIAVYDKENLHNFFYQRSVRLDPARTSIFDEPAKIMEIVPTDFDGFMKYVNDTVYDALG